MNMTVTNVDQGSVIFKDAQFRDETLAVEEGDAGAILEGTLLARRLVETDVTVAADSGNTGDGTVTDVTVQGGSVIPQVGGYALTCTAAATNGGTFQLVGPDGNLIANELVMDAGSGNATTFQTGGLEFTITDGDDDFVVGDEFTLTVATDGDMVLFATDGVGGAQIPQAVLTHQVTATAGANAIRPMVSGSVKRERLVIHADEDGDNITDEIMDQLRDYSIIPIDVEQLAQLDNQ